MKIHNVILFLFCLSFPLFCAEEYYRSNSNGLLLLQIEAIDRHKYEYIIQREFNEMEQEKTRILWKKNVIDKKWEYSYKEGDLTFEQYYQNGELREEYNYDRNGHKILQTEYRNGKVSKKVKYTYNKDGLVEQEEIDDIYLERKNKITYRYDSTFRIKQIIREMDDGTIVYWDAFFSKKGIVAKEYYTIGDESYIFYYGTNGEELKGEVIERVEDDSPEDNSDATADTVDNTDDVSKRRSTCATPRSRERLITVADVSSTVFRWLPIPLWQSTICFASVPPMPKSSSPPAPRILRDMRSFANG